jgi:hypothetical protein
MSINNPNYRRQKGFVHYGISAIIVFDRLSGCIIVLWFQSDTKSLNDVEEFFWG